MLQPDQIREKLKELGINQTELAEAIGMNSNYLNKSITGKREWKAHEMSAIERFFSENDNIEKIKREQSYINLPEIDIRAGLGLIGTSLEVHKKGGYSEITPDAIVGYWGIPEAAMPLRHKAHKKSIVIIQVDGDSMLPTIAGGDYVAIDTSLRRATGDGIYALWNGMGIVCKRVDTVLGTDPLKIRIISDNERHSTYEITADEARIYGKVIWVGRWL